MQRPHKTNLTAAAFSKMDGDRAIIIASICSDAATQIFKVLGDVLPCGIELHWITMCVDVLKLLSTAANISVRERAEKNHNVLSQVLAAKLKDIWRSFNIRLCVSSSIPLSNQEPDYIVYGCK
jgi:hypothetical protein